MVNGTTAPRLQRGSGILFHLTSLPGPHGVGDLGPGARNFVDFLYDAGQTYWQILPLAPTGAIFSHSPYMGLSAFAGNPLLINLDALVDQGLLADHEVHGAPEFDPYLVDYERVAGWKNRLLAQACDVFLNRGGRQRLEAFLDRTPWLHDYALFMTLRQVFDHSSWARWPEPLRDRRPDALGQARREHQQRFLFHCFCQYCFHRQWQGLKRYAEERGIRIIGDLPIYVGFDSADVWAHQSCFSLDQETRLPTSVAGVPPDYFSATGQRWGNPLYCWQQRDGTDNEPLYRWWRQRFRRNFDLVDIVRIDHFRGFESYWEIPAEEETAVNGRWVRGPGSGFFMKMARSIGSLPIIAEDLGIITPAVAALRDQLGFPGMKILQFAFDGKVENSYLPHNFVSPNCVVYTGTHDNDTTVGWYLSESVQEAGKEQARRYAHSNGDEINWDFIRMAYGSIAAVAIIPLQDVLGFGADCRMNVPSTTTGNWRWRCAPRFMTPEVADRLAAETRFYNRLPGRRQATAS